MGDDGDPASAFPLQACDGDCDSDDDCFGNLKCLQRGGDEEVPGCIGTYAVAKKDYCYDLNPTPQTSGPTKSPVTVTSAPTKVQSTKSPTPLPTSPPTSMVSPLSKYYTVDFFLLLRELNLPLNRIKIDYC